MRLLRDRRLAALLVAEVVSSTGTQMTWVAIPWFVLRTTGSPQRMTWVIIAEVLPVALLGFWGGAIAARVGTRRTMLVCDLARAPLFAAIPALHAVGLLPFPVLLALVAASGVFLAPYFSVQRSVVPELVGEEHVDVAQATAFFQAASRLTIFVGPPLAGVLISLIGAAEILYVDAASYLLSFVLLALFVHPPQVESEERPSVLSGVRFLLRDRLLRIWTPAFTLIDVCWMLLFASLPVLVVTHYHANPRILGWLFGALGGGALVGAFVSMWTVRRFDDPLALGTVAFTLQVASLWILVVPAPWPVPFTAMALAGFAMSNVNAPIQALTMLRMPKEVRTQGVAAFGVFQCIASPVGLLLAGWALARYDTRSVLVVVLGAKTIAVVAFAAAAIAERSSLRAAAVDSAA
jgi:predicted MFS family arabinose efflux permease